jgi:LAO/AO transport system kinase
MEVPDVLVVTKADLGDAAAKARRDLDRALAALGSSDVPVVAVSSVPPPHGVEELADALDAHRAGLDLAEQRVRGRRQAALREFSAERGEAAVRAIGGRREAERLLAGQDAALATEDLIRELERRAAGP